MGVILFFIEHIRTTLCLFVLLVAWGMWSAGAIPVSAEPEITVPFVSTTTILPGASADDVERLVTRPLEDELLQLDGLVSLRSFSSLSAAVTVAEFEPTFDLNDALIDIDRAVQRAEPMLPSDAEKTVIEDYTTNDFPLLTIAITGEVPKRALMEAAKRLQAELERLTSVSEAELGGVPDEVLEIIVDVQSLDNFGVTLQEVNQALSLNNSLIPIGVQDADSGRYEVQLPSIIRTYEDAIAIPVKVVDGIVVTLGQVATLRRANKQNRNYTRINGHDAVALNIFKAPNANDIDTAQEVSESVDKARELLASFNISAEIVSDQSFFARDMVKELSGNIGTSIVLVMILVVAALGLRAGLLVGMGIPVCFLAAFGVLDVSGLSFNFMVMFGFLLSMGMLIDSAIVLVEYANLSIKRGLTAKQGYVLAVKRMGMPIIFSMLTTLAAFIPLILWPGITGEFMKFLPITVFSVLGASLLYGLIFLPALGIVSSKMTANKSRTAQKQLDVQETIDADEYYQGASAMQMRYKSVLEWGVANSRFTLLLTIVFVCWCMFVYGKFGNGTTFFSNVEQTYAQLHVRGTGNYSTDDVNAIMREIEPAVQGIPEIQTYRAQSTSSRNGYPDDLGRIFIELTDPKERERTASQVWAEIEQRLESYHGIYGSVDVVSGGPPVGSDIEVDVLSTSQIELEEFVAKFKDWASTHPHLTSVQDTVNIPVIDWRITVDKERAATLGTSVSEVGAILQLATSGLIVGSYRPDDSIEELDIVVRLPRDEQTVNRFSNFVITTPRGQVPLSSIIEVTPTPSVGVINRKYGRYYAALSANLTDEAKAEQIAISDVNDDMQEWIRGQYVPPSIELRFGGAVEAQQETSRFLIGAMLLAIFTMLLMLITMYNNFFQAFLTITAIVLSLGGVALLYLMTGRPFSIVLGGMGIVTLAGVVVNNNIVLIDTYNYIRKQRPDYTASQAAILTGVMRFRPIFLTTTTTVFGLLPLALGLSLDVIERSVQVSSRVAVYWEQLAGVLVSGLLFASVLTLLFTPTALAWWEQPSLFKWRDLGALVKQKIKPARV